MKYTIIEDCSPYYIRFTHDGIEDVIERAKHTFDTAELFKTWSASNKFLHCRLSVEDGVELLDSIPFAKQMPMWEGRVSYFVSRPGLYYRAHKDGVDHRFSLNYTIEVLDDKCVTSWYSDTDLQQYQLDHLSSGTSRECIGFDKRQHSPVKSMVAKQGECILFNTDIYHDWDNSLSSNRRIVLTLRHKYTSSVYFDDAKKILFGGLAHLGEHLLCKQGVIGSSPISSTNL